jgi:hypothetical protein
MRTCKVITKAQMTVAKAAEVTSEEIQANG